ncbi:MAG: UDP-N-acetylmuramoyl-L-alanine--D-glutamate ligase [bacterium]
MAVSQMSKDTGSFRERLAEERVGVYGLGRTGRSVLKHLRGRVNSLVAFDDEVAELPVGEDIGDVEGPYRGHSKEIFEVDRLVVSPGVPVERDLFRKLESRDIPVIGEIELAYRLMDAGFLYAITGTNGKSTCTELIGTLLEQSLDTTVEVCGNRGRPFLDAVMESEDSSGYVVEVSSFQIQTMNRFHSDRTLLTNLGDDHQDRHENVRQYHRIKGELLERTKGSGRVVFPVGALNKEYMRNLMVSEPQRVTFTRDQVRGLTVELSWDNGLRMNEHHFPRKNIPSVLQRFPENILASIALINDRLDWNGIKQGIEQFTALPHRVEDITPPGADFAVINDSKATNPHAVINLLKTIDQPIRIVIGGGDKDAEYTQLFDCLSEKQVREIVLCGDEALVERCEELVVDRNMAVQVKSDWESAVKTLVNNACSDETIVLSPGATSFDEFENYKRRGESFKEWVREATRH